MPTPGQPLSGSTQQSDDNLGQDLAGLFWEPIPEADDYHHQARGAGIAQIPGNAFHNLADWGQGLATMGSLVGARMLETASGQSPFRSTDVDSFMNFAKATIDDYKTGYIDPIATGNYSALYRRAATRPLDVASDALMLSPGVKAIGRLPSVAKATEGASLGAAAAKQRLFGHLEQLAQKTEPTSKAAAWVKEKALRDGIVNEARRAAHSQFQRDSQSLDNAYKAIPVEERVNLMGKLEGWDPEVLQHGQDAGMSDAARNYRDVAGGINLDNEWKLMQMGHVKSEQVFREKWKPLIKAWFRATYGIEKDIDLKRIPLPKLMKLTEVVANTFKKRGIHPIHVPRMTPKNLEAILRNPGELPAWAQTHGMQRANALAEGLPIENVPKSPFEYERTAIERGEQFSVDVLSLHKARRLQVLQAHELLTRMLSAITDAAQDVTKLSAEQIAILEKNPNMMRFKPREFFGSLMDAGPVTTAFDTTQTVQRIFAEEVFIPRPLAQALTKMQPWKVGSLEKWFQGFANFARRYILGFNLLWPEKQFGQNLVMLGMFQWQGPKDALVSFASYALMTDPKVRALVPEMIKGEAFAAEAGSPAFGGMLGKVQGAVDRGVDFTFQRGQFYDRLSRATAGVYYALKLSERPELRGPIRGMINTGEAINRMEQVFANPALAEQVNKKVITVLGDYSRLAAKERQTLRSMLLWWMWYEHILKYSAALPANAPYKTALMAAIAETHTRLREDADGMPEGLKQAGAVKLSGMENDQGMPLYTLGGSLNPFVTITELVEFVRQPVEGVESSTVVGAMNPVFSLAYALGAGINPQTGRGFRDPRMVSIGGRQYKYDELQSGLLKEQEPRPLMAGGLEYAMRVFFPQPTRLAERLFAKASTGGEPSQFTSVLSGEGAPRVVYDSGGEPLAAGSYWDIVKEALLGQRAFPIDEEATEQNEAIDPYRMKKALRAADRQINTDNY